MAQKTTEKTTANEKSLRVESSAFQDKGMIPAKYTADGENVSPPLSWSAGPKGTTCYALVVDDPDAPAGTWVHWIAWNIHGTSLEEGASKRMPPGAVQG